MAQYEKIFTKPYEDGYENLPSQNTPITAQTLNDKDTAIEHIENFLDGKEVLTPTEKTDFGGAVNKITENEQNGYLKNKNLLSGIENGTINSSGTDIANIQYARNVGFIPVISGKTYTMSLTPTGGKTIRISTNLFESLISGVTQELALQNDSITFTVPDGINYVRFVYFTTGTRADYPETYISNAQFEENSTATAYMQYAPSNIELANSKADITAIGTDESGRTTASKAYAIGEHFYKDGKFCTAKTAIASGATFTLNTNYVEGSVASVIDDKFAVIELTTDADSSDNIANYPTGFNKDNCAVLSLMIKDDAGSWRTAEGALGASSRFFVILQASQLDIVANSSVYRARDAKLVLMKLY